MGILLGIASLLLAVTAGGLWFRAIHDVAIERRRSRLLMGFGLAAVLGFAAFFHSPGLLGGLPAGLGLGLSLCMLGLRAVSAQAATTPTVAVGEPMRAFSAIDDSGATFSSAALAGRPYLLKFFRGHW